MKEPLIIYGAGGLGREILSLARALDAWEPIAFIDDTVPLNVVIKGIGVLGGMDALRAIAGPRNLVIAIGDPGIKKALIQSLIPYNVQYPVLIHPMAIVQDRESVLIGEGSVIAAGSILTTDIRIGNHVLINLNSTVGHDTTIGAYASVMCGVNIAGRVTVGDGVMIGSGANILNDVSVGSGCKVGMGAVVTKNVASGLTVVGIPAKPITL